MTEADDDEIHWLAREAREYMWFRPKLYSLKYRKTDKAKAFHQNWLQTNRERLNKCDVARQRKWRKANPEGYRAANRRARLRQKAKRAMRAAELLRRFPNGIEEPICEPSCNDTSAESTVESASKTNRRREKRGESANIAGKTRSKSHV